MQCTEEKCRVAGERSRLLGGEVRVPREVVRAVDSLLGELAEYVPGLPPGATPLRHLELILSALGLDPSPLDLQMLAAEKGNETEGYVNMDVYSCIEYFMRRKSSQVELVRAYRLLDPHDKGYVSLDDMRAAAEAAGEDMADVELQELLDAADVSRKGHVTKEDVFNFMKEIHFSLKDG